MTMTREERIDANFTAFLRQWRDGDAARSPDLPVRDGSSLSGRQAVDFLDSQMTARHLDLIARELKAVNQSFYTIGSTGHEGNCAIAAALRLDDIGFLHYRSGAFMAQRAKQLPGESQIYNILLSLCAAAEDPISGGRHKVFGSKTLNIPPQTSTIASQLPKAMGAAFGIDRGRRLGIDTGLHADSIAFCSFGDASLNHSTAQGAINTAEWAAFQGWPMPILWICEDNGIGISVETPEGWVASAMAARAQTRYFTCDGLDIADTYETALAAAAYCRDTRRPAFLHMRCVRLLGHAGTDVDVEYLGRERIEAMEARDPLLRTARLLLDAGIVTASDILAMYEDLRTRIHAIARETVTRPKLTSITEVMRPLSPYSPDAVRREAERADYMEARVRLFDGADKLPEASGRPRHFALLHSLGLRDLLAKYPEAMVFGEDVAKKGGVYNITSGLLDAAGPDRVFNTLLDEQSILGFAQGVAHLNMLPVPEIQYLAYYHNAEDQLRGEAGSLQYFSNGQFRNPMVVRIQGYSYQKGFGGHFHNDNSIAAIRDIPGIVIATPSRGDDAVNMMRTCMALAKVDGRVVVFLEPIALYMTRDLYTEKDGLWQSLYPPPGQAIAFGEIRVYHEDAGDMTLLTFGNGVHLSLQAEKILREQHGIRARVVDLRWLCPLPREAILREAEATGNVLIVDETRDTGGLGEGIATLLALSSPRVRMRRIAAADTYVPLGPAAYTALPSVDGIVREARALRDGAGSAGRAAKRKA